MATSWLMTTAMMVAISIAIINHTGSEKVLDSQSLKRVIVLKAKQQQKKLNSMHV